MPSSRMSPSQCFPARGNLLCYIATMLLCLPDEYVKMLLRTYISECFIRGIILYLLYDTHR